MSDGSPADYGAELAGGVFEVASQFINQKIVEAIRKNFSGDGKRQRGDFYMRQSRELLQTHFQEIRRQDKQHILRMFKMVKNVQLKMDDANISGVQRFMKTVDYKRLSKLTYKIVVKASNRGLDSNVMHQMADDMIGKTVDPQAQSESNSSSFQPTHTTASDPFADSHQVRPESVLSGVDTSNVSQVDVETYQSEATGDRAVLVGLHRRDASTEHLLATSSFEYGSTDTVDTHAYESTSLAPWVI